MGKSPIRLTNAMVASALTAVLSTGRAQGACSPSDLDAVHAELRAAGPPLCGPRPLRRAFRHARQRAAMVTARAALECAIGQTPNITAAHRALLRVLAKVRRSGVAETCALTYEDELERLDADISAAANGTETTTTTSPPGTPTTTTQPTCVTVRLEVDKGDCTRVTSVPRGLVVCGTTCDVMTFTVPASGSLRLEGKPAPGDVGVTFGTDCNDDGTVPLGDASPPDCSLSCDCSSGAAVLNLLRIVVATATAR